MKVWAVLDMHTEKLESLHMTRELAELEVESYHYRRSPKKGIIEEYEVEEDIEYDDERLDYNTLELW